MNATKHSKPVIGERVIWYQREDLAWYTMVIKSDLVGAKDGVERLQVTYEDYPDEPPRLIPLNEVCRLPEKY